MNPNTIIDALANTPDAPFGYVDYFALTFQCSHVRYCCGLWDANDYLREEALAWILKRNEEKYKSNWIDSVATSTFESSTIPEISSAIDAVAKEIEKSDFLADPKRLPIEASDMKDVVLPFRIKGLKLYDYGPTAVFIWQRNSEFNFLELHYES